MEFKQNLISIYYLNGFLSFKKGSIRVFEIKIRDHAFSTYSKFPEKLTFLTP